MAFVFFILKKKAGYFDGGIFQILSLNTKIWNLPAIGALRGIPARGGSGQALCLGARGRLPPLAFECTVFSQDSRFYFNSSFSIFLYFQEPPVCSTARTCSLQFPEFLSGEHIVVPCLCNMLPKPDPVQSKVPASCCKNDAYQGN